MEGEPAILAVVSDVVQPGGFVRAGTGVLRAFGELADSINASGFVDLEENTEIKGLRITEMRDHDAVVEFDAVRTSVGTDIYGRRIRASRSYSGPVVLAVEHGEWKVVDLLVDGRSMRSSVFVSNLVARLGGVEVALLGGSVQAGASRVFLFVEVKNGLGRELKVEDAAIGAVKRRGGWRWRHAFVGSQEFVPGVTRVTVQTQLSRVAAGDALRLVLRTADGLIDLRPDAASPQLRYPVWFGFRHSWWRFRRSQLFDVVYAAAAGVVIGSWLGSSYGGRVWVGALVFVVLSAFFLSRSAPSLKFAGTRTRAVWLGWLTGAAVIGALLAVIPGGAWRLQTVYRGLAIWWFAGLLLLVASLLVVISKVRRYRGGDRARVRMWLLAALGLAVPGVLLMSTHGGFWPTTTDRSSVISYVHADEPREKVLSAIRLVVDHRGPCGYAVWGVKTNVARWWVVINTNTNTFTLWQRDEFFNLTQLVDAAQANDRYYALHGGNTPTDRQLRATSC